MAHLAERVVERHHHSEASDDTKGREALEAGVALGYELVDDDIDHRSSGERKTER